jgi:hypothetical protein
VAERARRADREEREASGDGKARGDWAEQKRRKNRLAKLPGERDRVLAAIETAEARAREIEALYCSDGFFERTGKAEVDALEQEKAELGPKIEALVAEWEAIEAELAAAEGA